MWTRRNQGNRLRYKVMATIVLLSVPLTALALSFTSIDVPGALRSAAKGINASGDIVGWYQKDSVLYRANVRMSLNADSGQQKVRWS